MTQSTFSPVEENAPYITHDLEEAIISETPISPTDLFIFWANLRFPDFLAEAILLIERIPTPMQYEAIYYWIFMALTKTSFHQDLLAPVLQLYNQSDHPLDFLPSLTRYFANQDLEQYLNLWASTTNPPVQLLATASVSHFDINDDFFTFLQKTNSENQSFMPAVIRYFLLFHSPNLLILNDFYSHLMSLFMGFPNDLLHRTLVQLNAERLFPFSTAGLVMYDTLNAFPVPNIICCPHRFKNGFSICLTSMIDQYHLMRTLVNHVIHRFDDTIDVDPIHVSDVFSTFISNCREAQVNDNFSPISFTEYISTRSIPAEHKDEPLSPIPLQFVPEEIPQTTRTLVDSPALKSKVLVSRIVDIFSPLADLGTPTEEMLLRGRPPFYIAVMGGPNEHSDVLNGFVQFMVNQPTHEISRNLSFLLVPVGDWRFIDLLKGCDDWFRLVISSLFDLIDNSFPQFENDAPSILDKSLTPGPATPHDIWRTFQSPFHIFNRILSFYAICAQMKTDVPIWTCKILQETTFLSFFVDSLYAGLLFAPQEIKATATLNISGSLKYNLCGPNGSRLGPSKVEKFAQGFSIAIESWAMPDKPQPCRLSDECLIVTIPKNKPKEGAGQELLTIKKTQFLVNKISFESEKFFNLYVDSVKYDNVKSFHVKRLRHPLTKAHIYFPIKHFASLDPYGL